MHSIFAVKFLADRCDTESFEREMYNSANSWPTIEEEDPVAGCFQALGNTFGDAQNPAHGFSTAGLLSTCTGDNSDLRSVSAGLFNASGSLVDGTDRVSGVQSLECVYAPNGNGTTAAVCRLPPNYMCGQGSGGISATLLLFISMIVCVSVVIGFCCLVRKEKRAADADDEDASQVSATECLPSAP